MKRPTIKKPRLITVLNAIKILLVLVATLAFIRFNAKLAEEFNETKQITSSTNQVVKSQADILHAIKAVTDDTHTTAAQQTAIIICMLQVPIEQRTTDLQSQCRNAANAEAAGNASGTSQSSTGVSGFPSSSQSTPVAPTPLSDNPQTVPATPAPTQPSKPLVEQLLSPIKSLINAL